MSHYFNEIRTILRDEPLFADGFSDEQWIQLQWVLHDNYLLPFIFAYTRKYPQLPSNVAVEAKKFYEDTLIINDYTIALLKEIQGDLSTFGRIVMIKGCALLECAYPEPAMRPMGDIDIYLPDGAINEVASIFIKAGFQQYDHYQNVLSNGKMHIDLHEDLWNAQRIAARKDIVAGISETFIPSTLIPGFFIPSRKLLAIHTAYHCIKHNFSRLIWVLDLLMLYKAGYFHDVIKNGRPSFALYALEWLADRKLIDLPPIETAGLSGVRKSLLKKITGIQSDAGLGEFALALLCPSSGMTIRYLSSTIFPPKHILKEMYGNLPFHLLLVKRIHELCKHLIRMRKWTKK